MTTGVAPMPAAVLEHIARLADDLTEPRRHVEPIYTPGRSRRRRLSHVWCTTQPGLIHALWEAIEPSTHPDWDARRTGYGPTPPLCLEAVSRYAAIQIGVVRLCWTLRVEQRDTTTASIRAVVGAAAAADHGTQEHILAELHTWRTWCAVMTGWQTPAYAPRAPCPAVECSRPGTLRINLTHRRALCVACHATWNPDTIGVLADYIRTYTNRKAA
jgi:hypothetical protein